MPEPAVVARPRPASTPAARKAVTMAQAAVNFREEYHYVVSDLRRVAILAAAVFVILIGLSFIL